jgi:hypothetical protein
MEGKRMYERMVMFLEEAQTIWTLASSWLAGLRRWYNDPNTNRISFEAGTMTDGVSLSSIFLLHFKHILTCTTARSSTSCTLTSSHFNFGLAKQDGHALQSSVYSNPTDRQTAEQHGCSGADDTTPTATSVYVIRSN